uniref:Uncharacterized protein n=1 Tax=Phlebotomus papatasi TaxID=29031 RepID=A0A1B0DD63_PHLPP
MEETVLEMGVSLDGSDLDRVQKYLAQKVGSAKADQVADQLKNLIDKVKDLPDEEKKAYVQEFGGRLNTVKEAVKEKIAEKVQYAITINIIVQILFYVIVGCLILWATVFIGRKLYKTLTAKDRKQAEKKKLKEEKKAKQKDESKNTKKSKGERDKSKTKQN